MTGLPAVGTATAGDGALTYTPASDAGGHDNLTYRVCDLGGRCDTASVSVTATPPGGAPSAGDDTARTAEGMAVEIDVLANDSGGTDLAAAVAVGPEHGTATPTGDGSAVVYTPAGGFCGTDSFTYVAVADGAASGADAFDDEVCDAGGRSDTGRVDVTMASQPDVPVAQQDEAATDEDVAVEIDVLANDSDADDEPLVVVLDTAPAHGAVTVAGPRITYVPVGTSVPHPRRRARRRQTGRSPSSTGRAVIGGAPRRRGVHRGQCLPR